MLDTPNGRKAHLDVVRNISRALAETLDELGVLRAVHAELTRALDFPMCFFGRYDAASQNVTVIWQMNEGEELPGGQFPLGSGATSDAIRTRQPRLIRNWSTAGPAVRVQYATERPSLPESSIVVPVLYADQVVGVFSIQSYAPQAYDEEDVRLLTAVADLIALAVFRGIPVQHSEAETILASMEDALVVLDKQARVVRLNRAARVLLCSQAGGVIFGQPIDQPQADHWPLGNEHLSEQLRPVVERLQRGSPPEDEVELELGGTRLRCRATVLHSGNADVGAVMVLRRSA
jgi:putative methionine-R-sulfoxide reductase with GAF domain